MNISNVLTYKVIEHNNFVAIVPQDGIVKGANNLIIADWHTCLEYLHRYLEARANGMEIVPAHEKALRGAIVIRSGKPS